jgi:hypothetical protein
MGFSGVEDGFVAAFSWSRSRCRTFEFGLSASMIIDPEAEESSSNSAVTPFPPCECSTDTSSFFYYTMHNWELPGFKSAKTYLHINPLNTKASHACSIKPHMLRLFHTAHFLSSRSIVYVQVFDIRVVIWRINPCFVDASPEIFGQDLLEDRCRTVDTQAPLACSMRIRWSFRLGDGVVDVRLCKMSLLEVIQNDWSAYLLERLC